MQVGAGNLFPLLFIVLQDIGWVIGQKLSVGGEIDLIHREQLQLIQCRIEEAQVDQQGVAA